MIATPFSFVCRILCGALCIAVLHGCGGSAATKNADASRSTHPPARASASPISPSSATGAVAGPALSQAGTPADAAAASQTPAPQTQEAPRVATPQPAAQASAAGGPAASTAADRVALQLKQGRSGQGSGEIMECWLPLVQKLQNDPKATPEIIQFFCSLPAYSPHPMSVKVKELFTSAFMRKPKTPDDGTPKPPPSRIFRNIVTAASMQKCADFLVQYKDVFDAVEKKYPVPRNILASLLYVETRLGTYVGKENAFWSLACMAAANSPESVSGSLSDIPITSQHDTWLQAKLTEKSNWAYNELRALLSFCNTQNLDPHSMPGSVYGAIGICQFMPSNLVPYGDDGDGDGIVNLFSVPDAIFSAASYLTKHGWQQGTNVASQRAVLKRYNNLNIYANTILALAESVSTGVVQTGPPDGVTVASAPKKAPAKASAKKSAKKK